MCMEMNSFCNTKVLFVHHALVSNQQLLFQQQNRSKTCTEVLVIFDGCLLASRMHLEPCMASVWQEQVLFEEQF